MTRHVKILLAAALLGALVGCDSRSSQSKSDATPSAPSPTTPAASTSVHSITLPTIDTPLPSGPNVEKMAYCQICHSPRYVLMQPTFPKKTWVAEVDKMRKIYGAPIQDADAASIVDYLVAIRGNGQ